jgi:hypothetical protein
MKKLKIPIPRGINVAIAIPIALSSLPKLVCFSFCDHKITYRSLQKPCRYSHFKKFFSRTNDTGIRLAAILLAGGVMMLVAMMVLLPAGSSLAWLIT